LTIDEGYIKYSSDWTQGPAPEHATTDLLETWRRPLYHAGLIGHYEDLGIGFGNISIRSHAGGLFVISGTQTGHIAQTRSEHYTLVTAYDVDANHVTCAGPVQASSESLTHAAIYDLDDAIEAVVHVHSRILWERLRDRLPTTSADISYGTPEMAREFVRLYRDTDFAADGIAIMAGHEEGIVSIGRSLEEAASRVLAINETAG
jgi:ribulose-5-phosphate 4-epimerase/fuculose-1-phosphate aldolase